MDQKAFEMWRLLLLCEVFRVKRRSKLNTKAFQITPAAQTISLLTILFLGMIQTLGKNMTTKFCSNQSQCTGSDTLSTTFAVSHWNHKQHEYWINFSTFELGWSNKCQAVIQSSTAHVTMKMPLFFEAANYPKTRLSSDTLCWKTKSTLKEGKERWCSFF